MDQSLLFRPTASDAVGCTARQTLASSRSDTIYKLLSKFNIISNYFILHETGDPAWGGRCVPGSQDSEEAQATTCGELGNFRELYFN